MSKHAPRRFGDKVDVEVSQNLDVRNLSDAELVARTRACLAKLGIETTGPLLLGYTEPAGDDKGDPKS